MAPARMPDDHVAAEDVPLICTWYEDATAAIQALGLGIELPDVGSKDPEYWSTLDRQAWRDALRGRVVASDEEIDHGDPDWLLLQRIPGAPGPGGVPDERDEIQVWFDLEEGIRFRFRPRSAAHVRALIRNAAEQHGLTLSRTWPGNVVALPTVMGGGLPEPEEIDAVLEVAGWIRGRKITWTMEP